jgi:hypothetical protein
MLSKKIATREITRSLALGVGEDQELLELRIPMRLPQSQTAGTRYELVRFSIEGPAETEGFDCLAEAADAWEKITGERPAVAVELSK